MGGWGSRVQVLLRPSTCFVLRKVPGSSAQYPTGLPTPVGNSKEMLYFTGIICLIGPVLSALFGVQGWRSGEST